MGHRSVIRMLVSSLAGLLPFAVATSVVLERLRVPASALGPARLVVLHRPLSRP